MMPGYDLELRNPFIHPEPKIQEPDNTTPDPFMIPSKHAPDPPSCPGANFDEDWIIGTVEDWLDSAGMFSNSSASDSGKMTQNPHHS